MGAGGRRVVLVAATAAVIAIAAGGVVVAGPERPTTPRCGPRAAGRTRASRSASTRS